MEKINLINVAEIILSKVKEGDIYGIGSKQEYLDDETIAIAEKWVQDIHDFAIQSTDHLAKELCELWYINKNCVSKERIKRAIEILKKI